MNYYSSLETGSRVKTMLKNLYKQYRRWKQRDFLKWRDEVSDYERDFFLQELKGRCEELLKYFEMIDDYSKNHVDDRVFGETLRKLIMPKELEKLIPAEKRPPTPEVLAKSFFETMREMNSREFIVPLKKVLQYFSKPLDLKTYGEMLTQINHVCSTVVQVREKLFLYRLSGFATVHKVESGEMVAGEPSDYKVMLTPFQNILDNIYGVANSTSQTIHQWHKEQMEWKTNFLSVLTERLAQRNNLLTIIVAITISWFFLSVSNPYEKLGRDRDYSKLTDKVVELDTQNKSYVQKIGDKDREISELKIALDEAKKSPKSGK